MREGSALSGFRKQTTLVYEHTSLRRLGANPSLVTARHPRPFDGLDAMYHHCSRSNYSAAAFGRTTMTYERLPCRNSAHYTHNDL